MYLLFVILIVIASILMIGIVLIQESKGGGLASNFSSSNQIMGVRKTTDFIEKATWGLAIAMVLCSIVCAHVAPTATTDQSVIEKTADSNTNPTNMPISERETPSPTAFAIPPTAVTLPQALPAAFRNARKPR